MQETPTPCNAIEAEAGQQLRSALPGAAVEWLGPARRIRDRMAGEVIAELAATEEGCEAITKALFHPGANQRPSSCRSDLVAVGCVGEVDFKGDRTCIKSMTQRAPTTMHHARGFGMSPEERAGHLCYRRPLYERI